MTLLGLLAAFAVELGGCAPPHESGYATTTLYVANWDAMQLGMSPHDVHDLLGTPSVFRWDPATRALTWTYPDGRVEFADAMEIDLNSIFGRVTRWDTWDVAAPERDDKFSLSSTRDPSFGQTRGTLDVIVESTTCRVYEDGELRAAIDAERAARSLAGGTAEIDRRAYFASLGEGEARADRYLLDFDFVEMDVSHSLGVAARRDSRGYFTATLVDPESQLELWKCIVRGDGSARTLAHAVLERLDKDLKDASR